MDMTWVTDRIAVGGGIWVDERMAEVVRAGVTHVIDMQLEFDDTALGERAGVEVLWNPVDDDFEPKEREVFERGVNFALARAGGSGGEAVCALRGGSTPCADDGAGGAVCDWDIRWSRAKRLIQTKRYVVDFAEVYVRSVEQFLKGYVGTDGRAGISRKDGDRRV